MTAAASPPRKRSSAPRAGTFLVALSLLSTAMSGLTFAQPSATDRRQAEALFLEAKKLMAQGKIEEACQKFEGSYKIDQAGGTAINLALCHEKEGKIASAWADFKDALALAKKARRRDREKIARDHLDALEPKLPYFLVIPDKSDLDGLSITVDEGPIANEAFGAQIPIDPGVHRVKAEAPKHDPWEGTFEALEGKKVTVRVPALTLTKVIPTATASAGPAAGSAPRFPWMRPSGIALASVGVAAMIVGGVFGIQAVSSSFTVNQNCGENLGCTSDGFSAVQEGRTSATAADILLAAGGGFAAAGVAFFIVGGMKADTSEKTASSVRLSPVTKVSANGAMVGLEGAW